MLREISAGGVVVRKREGVWWMAAIEPPNEATGPAVNASVNAVAGSPRSVKKSKPVLALPKGAVDPGEKPLQTALREIHEETGLTTEAIAKLGDSKYVYTRAWGDGQRVFKVVTFYLMRYLSGRINEITPEMRIEVARARWVRLEEAPALLAYKGEKQMAQRAWDYVQANDEV
jgi:ADP-ribose pyrophosphatase YjhB (NUDIX family)